MFPCHHGDFSTDHHRNVVFFFHHGDFCTNHQRNAFPFHFDDFFLLIANVMVSFLTKVVFLPTTEILSFFTTVVSVLISIEMQSHFIMMVSTKSWSDVDDDDFSTNHRRIALSFHTVIPKWVSFLQYLFFFYSLPKWLSLSPRYFMYQNAFP